MNRFFEKFGPMIRFATERAGVALTIALILSIVGFYFARQLRIDTDFSNLIPQSYPSVQALEKLRDTVGSETTADVVLQSSSFDANRAFAEEFIPRALALSDETTGEPYLTRVDYKKDTEFLENNALYFATDAELDSLESYLRGTIRDAKLEANPFFFDLDEDEEVEGEASGFDLERDLEEVYTRVVGKQYPINEDSTIMVLRFYPAGSQTNVGFIQRMYDDLERLVDEMNPGAYEPGVEVTLAGRLMRQLVEVRAVTDDVFRSFASGVTAVLLLVVLYFLYKGYTARAGHRYSSRALFGIIVRTPLLAVLIGTPLLMSLTWTFGVAYLAYDTLNLMTSTLGLVLFGLGIDYGIHFFARYTEERGRGLAPQRAAEVTFTSTGQAIAVGALTTAAALYVLMLADFRGFSEFGFIAGTGIILALLAMTMVLPALLVLMERFGLLNLGSTAVATSGNGRRRTFPGSKGIVLASIAAVVAALAFLPSVGFHYDFGALDPEYPSYEVKRDLVRSVYPKRGTNPAYVMVDDPSETRQVVEALRRHAAQDETPTIERVESIQDRFPMSPEGKQHKLDRIAEIRDLLSDPFVQQESGDDIDRLRRAAQTTEALTVEEVPESIRNQFTSKTGEIGGFVMIYPSVGLSDGRMSIAFSDDVGTIATENGDIYHSASTSLVAADMLRLMLKEAPYMVFLTFLIVIGLMWLNFGSVRWAALATVPLIVGVLWMILVMELIGLKLNFYNLVVLPAVLGIGNDAGVHLVHRYREEGWGSIMKVLRYTGEHITMGSVTTMIGFGGLLLSFHPGLKTIGELAIVGIGMTLLAALLFLPALLQWIESRSSAPRSKPEARREEMPLAHESSVVSG